jgi:hypothetical protein
MTDAKEALDMKIDGNCHCGKITYRAEIDPERVYICHCTDCQSITGSAFRWAVPVPEADFELLTGEPRTYVKRADSGATSHQLFCPDCASPLYSTSLGEGPKWFNLRLGTARQRSELRPASQCWHRSAQAWVNDVEAITAIETQ